MDWRCIWFRTQDARRAGGLEGFACACESQCGLLLSSDQMVAPGSSRASTFAQSRIQSLAVTRHRTPPAS